MKYVRKAILYLVLGLIALNLCCSQFYMMFVMPAHDNEFILSASYLVRQQSGEEFHTMMGRSIL